MKKAVSLLVILLLLSSITFYIYKIWNNGGGGGGGSGGGGGGGGGSGKFKNVVILDPTMTDLQDKINAITVKHGAWCVSPEYQFSDNRVLILLKPGVYPITLYLSYYMSVAGLGKSPSDVTVNKLIVWDSGLDTTDKGVDFNPCSNVSIESKGNRSTENFWRSVENLTIKEESFWSVSQAAPLRRVHCNGYMHLFQSGWASGGFTSDCIFDSAADPQGNQQWLFRNSSFGKTSVCQNWNTVFVGCEGQGGDKCDQTGQCVSVDDKDLTTVQKPTLFMEDGIYKILRPEPKQGSGAIKLSDYTEGDVFTNIYIASDEDSARIINDKIEKGFHIILSPGIYKLEDSIVINKADTMIIGFGIPTLISPGKPCIVVNDVSGVSIGSVMLDCGPEHTNTLLQWGTKKENHTGYAHDIYARVGGPVSYNTSCDSMVVINNSGVIGDNFWLWRADHGEGMNADQTDFTFNVATNGLIVNGDNVVIYGLAVEHCQKDLVVWNGENGSTYWYQSEVPYDAPSGWDYYAYHVTDKVKKHTGIGLGSYSFLYQQNPPLYIPNAFKTPSGAGIKMSKMLTFNGNSPGGFTHIWNDTGNSAYKQDGTAHICD
jgi:hypothetical protein